MTVRVQTTGRSETPTGDRVRRFPASSFIVVSLAVSILVVRSPTSISASFPASCGAIGASAYEPAPVAIPEVDVASRGRIISVTNNSDVANGDVSSVQALAANPGPDGTSLREAIEATNNDPGVATITFSSQLAGTTIVVSVLPDLMGGNVFINGDIDDDGDSDITLQASSADDPETSEGLRIKSSENTLHAIALDGFSVGVNLVPVSAGGIYSDNVVSDLVMTRIGRYGILLSDPASGNSWVDTVVVGNTISVDHSRAPQSFFGGINLRLRSDSSLERSTIANNTIHVFRGGIPDTTRPDTGGSGVVVAAGGFRDSRAKAVDTLIADNTIEMRDGAGTDSDVGILVFAQGAGGNDNLVDGLRIVENRVSMTAPGGGHAIELIGGSEGDNTYASGNVMKNVWVLGNTIEGPGIRGIDLGKPTGSANLLLNVHVLGNNIAMGPSTSDFDAIGILIVGGSFTPSMPGGNNEASQIEVRRNTVQLKEPTKSFNSSAVRIIGGQFGADGNRVRYVTLAKNNLNGGGATGIQIRGGWNASDNAVSQTKISCNRVNRRTPVRRAYGGAFAKGITVVGGLNSSTGNSARARLSKNIVTGVLNDVAVISNLNRSEFPGPSSNNSAVVKICQRGRCRSVQGKTVQ